MGAAIDDAPSPKIGAGVVWGLANGRRAKPRHGADPCVRGIVNLPDDVANGGDIGAAGRKISSKLTRDEQISSVLHRRDAVPAILARAEVEGWSSVAVFDDTAHAQIAQAQRPSPAKPRKSVGGRA